MNGSSFIYRCFFRFVDNLKRERQSAFKACTRLLSSAFESLVGSVMEHIVYKVILFSRNIVAKQFKKKNTSRGERIFDLACKPPTIKMSMLYLKFYNTKHKCINNFHLAVQTCKNLLRKLYRKRESTHCFICSSNYWSLLLHPARSTRSLCSTQCERAYKKRERVLRSSIFFPAILPLIQRNIFTASRARPIYIYSPFSKRRINT